MKENSGLSAVKTAKNDEFYTKYTDIVTEKEDANFASPTGKYKFFTCSNNTLDVINMRSMLHLF